MNNADVFKGIRVADFSQGMAGPYCGQLLAHYGADVVKVEPPTGDWLRSNGRRFGDHSAQAMMAGRGKRSLALDLKAEQGPAGRPAPSLLDQRSCRSNITGLSSMGPEVVGKQLELLKEVAPKISRVAVLRNPSNQGHPFVLQQAEGAARALGLQLHVLQAGSPSEIDAAFAALRSERTNAALVLRDTLFLAQRTQIAALAAKSWLPVVSGFREEAEAGGLMAYGASVPFQYRGAADYVDKILKGAKPADLPVQQPTKFDLVINLDRQGPQPDNTAVAAPAGGSGDRIDGDGPRPAEPMMAPYQKPDWLTTHVFNSVVMLLTSLGLSVRGSRILVVRGRKSGQIRTTPVNPLEIGGTRYLVAPRGETEWVRNLRAARGGELRLGRHREPIGVEELPDEAKPPILREYLRRWKMETGKFFDGVTAESPESELRRIAPRHPVFKIQDLQMRRST
jgi:deazaflavin-dependent oxidoreductase (nitroreductase family)